jgi:hypothetical protein
MDLNAENASKARNEIDDYSKSLAEALRQPRSLHSPPNTNLPSPPSLPVVEEIGDDLSHYVTFKHPWGSHVLNPAILFLMLLAFTVAMLISLRVKDVR